MCVGRESLTKVFIAEKDTESEIDHLKLLWVFVKASQTIGTN